MAVGLAISIPLQADVPHLISYQGRVAVGISTFHGTGSFKFALVNGTGSVTYWSNDGTSTVGDEPVSRVSVQVTNGLYSLLLGDSNLANMTPIPPGVFSNEDVRLRIWFDDGTNGSQVLTPDKRIAAVGYAFVAEEVPDGTITTPKLADGAVTSEKLAPGVVQTANLAPGSVGNAQLVNSTLTITAGDGLAGGGSVSLGGAITFSNAGVRTLAASGGLTVSNATGDVSIATNANSGNTPGALVIRDGNGDFTAGMITAALNGNAATATVATSASNFTEALSGDVTGTQGATAIADAVVTGKLLTGFNSSPGVITAGDTLLSAVGKFDGNLSAKASTDSPTFTGTVILPSGSPDSVPLRLQAGVLQTEPSSGGIEFDGSVLYLTTGSVTPVRRALAFADAVIDGTLLADGSVDSSSLASNLALVGNTTGAFSGSLVGNATSATTAIDFSGLLAGDVIGTQGATTVATVGGLAASAIADGLTTVNNATPSNSPSTIVRRDSDGNFAAGTISADLNGNATTATAADSALSFTGPLSGDITGTQNATRLADAVVTSKVLTGFGSTSGPIAATDTILSAFGKIDGNLTARAPIDSPAFVGTVVFPAGSENKPPVRFQPGTLGVTPSLGDLEYDGSALYLTTGDANPVRRGLKFADDEVNGEFLAAGSVDGSKLTANLTLTGVTTGEFSGPLNGNAASATTAMNLAGSLAGDVTGTQSATVVNAVGGVSSTAIAAGIATVSNATAGNVPGNVVRRDDDGNFHAGLITADLNGNAATASVANIAASISGTLSGDITGTQNATRVADTIVTGKLLTGINLASGSIGETDTVLSAIGKLAGNLTLRAPGDSPAFTGTVVLPTGSEAVVPVRLQAGILAATPSVGGLEFDGSTLYLTVGDQSPIRRALHFSDGEISGNLLADGSVTGSKLASNLTLPGTTAGVFSGPLSGNASSASVAMNFTGTLAGEVSGPQTQTVVTAVGGQAAANVGTATGLALQATPANTSDTLVRRDGNGDFAAGTITANLNGAATSALTSTNFTGILDGDVTGLQANTTIAAATVTAKVLTGFAAQAGPVTESDSILSAIGKLQGNGVQLATTLDSLSMQMEQSTQSLQERISLLELNLLGVQLYQNAYLGGPQPLVASGSRSWDAYNTPGGRNGWLSMAPTGSYVPNIGYAALRFAPEDLREINNPNPGGFDPPWVTVKTLHLEGKLVELLTSEYRSFWEGRVGRVRYVINYSDSSTETLSVAQTTALGWISVSLANPQPSKLVQSITVQLQVYAAEKNTRVKAAQDTIIEVNLPQVAARITTTRLAVFGAREAGDDIVYHLVNGSEVSPEGPLNVDNPVLGLTANPSKLRIFLKPSANPTIGGTLMQVWILNYTTE